MISVNDRSAKSVTVGIINYNGEAVLTDTLKSVLDQDDPDIAEVLVVDDGSTDRSIALVREQFPRVRVIETGENRGPNPVRNRALREAKTGRVLVMDNDIVLSRDVVRLLSDALDQIPDAGIASAQIRHREAPDVIQYNGVNIHYIGGAVMNPVESDIPTPVGAVSGGTILIDREKALEIGLFDEDFYSGWEDGDFTFRMNLAGYPVLNVSRARVYHKKEATGLSRVAYQVRNRYWFMMKNYSLRTLLLIGPALLVNQLAVGGFMILKGHFGAFLKGHFTALTGIPRILQKRRRVMALKRRRDRELLTATPVNLMGDVNSKALRIGSAMLNGFLSGYWTVIKWLVP